MSDITQNDTNEKPTSSLKDKLPLLDLDLLQIKKDLIFEYIECSNRCLKHSSKWIAEMISAIEIEVKDLIIPFIDIQVSAVEFETNALATSYVNTEEYRRAGHVTRTSAPTTKSYFIGAYARYLYAETQTLDMSHDMLAALHNAHNTQLFADLRSELLGHDKNFKLDGYCLYLYGIVLLKLSLNKEALAMFCRAVVARPLLWSAWHELTKLITDPEEIRWLNLPDNWVYQMFLGLVNSELQHNTVAIKIYECLQNSGLVRSTFLQAQLATSYYNIRDIDTAEQMFQDLHKYDPYRIENMDSYSNILFVKSDSTELGILAHRCVETQKFREETCCIVGNFYSLRSNHDKALLYFQRALKLNPAYHTAWTLVGHEFMELKNIKGAIHAYRQAVEKCPRDFRSWYGLGQAYEIMNMTTHAIFYYRKAQMLRPNDSRLIMPLADSYEKLGMLENAKKCYLRAHYVRDENGRTLINLAALCEKMNNPVEAAAAYTEYIYLNPDGDKNYSEDYCLALKFLAHYHLKNGELDEAEAAAYKCSTHPETKYEGKMLLRQIASMRLKLDGHKSVNLNTLEALHAAASGLTGNDSMFSDANSFADEDATTTDVDTTSDIHSIPLIPET